MTDQNLQDIQTEAFGSGFQVNNIGELIGKFLPYIFGAAGIGLLIYLVLGGLQLMTSRGDPKAIESAKGKITNAIIGFIVVIFAYVIVAIIGQVFGIVQFQSIFNFLIPLGQPTRIDSPGPINAS